MCVSLTLLWYCRVCIKLLEKGADPNWKRDGAASIHVASGLDTAMQLLPHMIQNGADINLK